MKRRATVAPGGLAAALILVAFAAGCGAAGERHGPTAAAPSASRTEAIRGRGSTATTTAPSAVSANTMPRRRPGSTRRPVQSRTSSRPRSSPALLPALVSGEVVTRAPTRRRVVALTFDAGGDDAGAPKILAALRAAHATATFFLTGRWAELYPQWARRISARYPVGNHTYDHADLVRLPAEAVRQEIVRARAAIEASATRPPAQLFRFPYGSYDSAALRVANGLGYTAVGWTVDTLGWEGTSGGQSVASVIRRVLADLQPGEIVLMHVGANPSDHSTLDADALPALIRDLRARGYGLAALVPGP